MAKAKPDQHQADPYREVVVLHDTQTGAINAIGSINEKTGAHSTVPPLQSNHQQFMEVRKTSILRNLMNNLTNQAKSPTRFGIYVVPQKEMTDLVDNLYKLNDDDRNREARKAVQPYRISGRELDKIRFDRSEMPISDWIGMGVPREAIERNMTNLKHGLPMNELVPVRIKVGENNYMEGNYAVRMARNENDVADGRIYPPKPRPEFEEPQWSQVFTQEEKGRMAAQKPLDRLIPFVNRDTGQTEYCFARFDPLTNHIDPVSPRDVQLPEWAFREKLDDTRMREAKMGHLFEIRNGKVGAEGAVFSGKAQYDPYRDQYVTVDTRFQKPYIPQHVRDQLSPEQIGKLENYEAIDGRGIKGRDGNNYTTDIRVSRQTNTLEWGRYLGQDQAQDRRQGQNAPQPSPGGGQWPDNETYKAQQQGGGQSM